jgi:hypothetical protein
MRFLLSPRPTVQVLTGPDPNGVELLAFLCQASLYTTLLRFLETESVISDNTFLRDFHTLQQPANNANPRHAGMYTHVLYHYRYSGCTWQQAKHLSS